MSLYRQGKVPGSFYDGYGQEAVSAGAAFAMAPEDACASCTATSPRTSSAASRPARILAQYMGRAAGITRGRDGNVHFGDRRSAASGWSRCSPT